MPEARPLRPALTAHRVLRRAAEGGGGGTHTLHYMACKRLLHWVQGCAVGLRCAWEVPHMLVVQTMSPHVAMITLLVSPSRTSLRLETEWQTET